jgi:hypothetical protein
LATEAARQSFADRRAGYRTGESPARGPAKAFARLYPIRHEGPGNPLSERNLVNSDPEA